MKKQFLSLLVISLYFLPACSPAHYIGRSARQKMLDQPEFESAHMGITLYDPATGKYLYDYQGNKYFVPASNTKLFSCYEGMKHLGDSLAGIRYFEDDTAIYLLPTGDPTLLHEDYARQPVIGFLQQAKKHLYITDSNWKEEGLGSGWAWNDYNDDYMPERSALPVYGDVICWVEEKDTTKNENATFGPSVSVYSIPEINWPVHFNPDIGSKRFFVKRNLAENAFMITEGTEAKKEQQVPFVTNGIRSALELLPDTIDHPIHYLSQFPASNPEWHTLYSQPVDSMFAPMMHRSDNFFAEQTLLMVGNQLLGLMNDRRIIDTLLESDLKDLPQHPHWVDGSGLSRYNLFTPRDFVWVLNRMKEEFGMDRLKVVLATGGTGTLGRYYQKFKGRIFAKTGTLTGVVSLSGFLYTKKNRLLIFSMLVNNHNTSASLIRKKEENFLSYIYEKY